MTDNINPLQKLEITYVEPDAIQPNQYNANRQSDTEFELLCRSIEEDGATQPIIVHRETMQIVDGEHRWRAFKALGFKKIPIVLVDYTQAQRMIATLRHNRARGTEDISMAADVLKELQAMGTIQEAADSLLLDDIELNVMLEDIPLAEVKLRDPEKRLTAGEVEELISKEKKTVKIKQAEEQLMVAKDRNVTTLQFRCELFEGELINWALGENKAEKLIELLKTYE